MWAEKHGFQKYLCPRRRAARCLLVYFKVIRHVIRPNITLEAALLRDKYLHRCEVTPMMSVYVEHHAHSSAPFSLFSTDVQALMCVYTCICVLPRRTCVFVCGLQPYTGMGKKNTWRKLVLEDFPAKMLIWTARNLATCGSLLSALKMRHSASRPPISMWSALPWPVEFPPGPLAIVSPLPVLPQVLLLPYHSLHSVAIHTVLSNPPCLQMQRLPFPTSPQQTLLPICPRFPLFPISSSSWSLGWGLRQDAVRAQSAW